MSYGSEWCADHCYMVEEAYEKMASQAKQGLWTTKDGRTLHIDEMETSHLINTVNMLRRNNDKDINTPMITVMEEELRERGKA